MNYVLATPSVFNRRYCFPVLILMIVASCFFPFPVLAQTPPCSAPAHAGASYEDCTGTTCERMVCNGTAYVPLDIWDNTGFKAITFGNDPSACNASRTGRLRYNAGVWEYCSGSAWTAMAVDAVLPINASNATSPLGQIISFNGENFLTTGPGAYTRGNLSMGYRAGTSLSSSVYYNTLIGYDAGWQTTTGGSNVALGYNALSSNTTGYNNVAVGRNALTSGATGYNNVGVGTYVLGNNNNVGSVAIGYMVMPNSTGQYNVGIGWNVMTSFSHTSSRNTGIGANALLNLTTGSMNTAVGALALRDLTEGPWNAAFGTQALANSTTATHNTALGARTLEQNRVGMGNVAIGYTAMTNSRAKHYNVSVGMESMQYFTNSETAGVGQNVAVGHAALRGNSAAIPDNTGVYNAALGAHALSGTTSGSHNVGLGRQAGNINTTGSRNIMIGSGVQGPDPTTSNYVNIGNTIFGSMGNNPATPGSGDANITVDGNLEVNGGLKISDDTSGCDSSAGGRMRYNSTTKTMQYCNETAWTDM
jgi:hypothetical protein